MFETKKLHCLIFGGIALLDLIIIFIVAKVRGSIDTLQYGCILSAMVCVLTIFLRLSMFNRMISRGVLDAKSFRGTTQHKNMIFENILSLIVAAAFIGFGFLLQMCI